MKHDYATQDFLKDSKAIIIDWDKWKKRLDYVYATVTVLGLAFIGAYIWMHYMGMRPWQF